MKFRMVGGLWMVVLRFEFNQNRLSAFGTVGVEICPSPLTWPLAYTTACTTVQAVINVCNANSVLTLSMSLSGTQFAQRTSRELFARRAESVASTRTR